MLSTVLIRPLRSTAVELLRAASNFARGWTAGMGHELPRPLVAGAEGGTPESCPGHRDGSGPLRVINGLPYSAAGMIPCPTGIRS